MPRKLASVQVIHSIKSIEDADRIEEAMVMGWSVVIKKGEFEHGDKCVFFEIDSLLPQDADWAQFMEPRKYRVKTCKMRGVLSQGLALPISILPENTCLDTDTDLTELLGITKYERPSETESGMRSKSAGSFPHFIPKTDEPRVQSAGRLLHQLAGLPYYITEKVDGTSATFAKVDGELIVASRNLKQQDSEMNTYWDIARQYDLANKLPEGFAVQGEIAGTGIQKNRLGLQGHQLFVFNGFFIEQRTYMAWEELIVFCKNAGLQTVKEVTTGDEFAMSREDLLELAKGKYKGTKNHREGIVIRSVDKKISFKAINNDFLLKQDK